MHLVICTQKEFQGIVLAIYGNDKCVYIRINSSEHILKPCCQIFIFSCDLIAEIA